MHEFASKGTLREVARLALPVALLNLLGVVTLFIDILFCSRLEESEAALTALGFSAQIIFLIQVPMLGFSVGSAALISRAYGARERGRVASLTRQSIQGAVVLAALTALSSPITLPAIVGTLGAEGQVYDLALSYLFPIFLGIVFYFLQTLSFSLFRSTGDTRLPLLLGLLVNGLNVPLNWILIYGQFGLPSFGVQGAAFGTIISQGVGVFITLALIRRGALGRIPVSLRPSRFEGEFVRDIFRLGAPAALDLLLVNLSFLSMIFFLGRIGPDAVAAHGIGHRVQSLAFVPGLGIAQAIGALVGNFLGADNRDGALRVTRSGIILATILMGTIGAMLTLGRGEIAELFAIDPGSELFALTTLWIMILGGTLPIIGANVALIGALRGAGATFSTLLINMIGTLVFQIPLLYIGAELDGARGIWLSFPIAYFCRTMVTIWIFRRGNWAKTGLRA